MTWPWVSRRAWDMAERRAEQLDVALAQCWRESIEALVRERDRYDALVRDMLAAKLASPASPETFGEPAVDLPVEIQQALDATVPEDSPARRACADFAARRLGEGREADSVASEIMAGADLEAF